MQRLLFACAVLLAACAGDTPDGSGVGSFGAACTVVADADSTECTSGVCTDAFDQIGHPVCSQRCSPGVNEDCPAGSMGKMCNMKGYCRP